MRLRFLEYIELYFVVIGTLVSSISYRMISENGFTFFLFICVLVLPAMIGHYLARYQYYRRAYIILKKYP